MNKNCSVSEKAKTSFLDNEKKTKIVTVITLLTMFVEIAVGHWSGSMSLLADGWHMASHTLALFLSLVVYYLYRHPKFSSAFTFGGGKILSLGGYTSAMMLILIAISMVVESVQRFSNPRNVHYNEAIFVAVMGLIVNIICAMILYKGEEASHDHHGHHDHHHDHGHSHSHSDSHDANHESAYVHILTDALTSVFAIMALTLGMWKGWTWADPAVGILGGAVVFKWSLGLMKQSGADLLDAHDESIDRSKLIAAVEADGSEVVDVHLWKLAPGQVGCELVVRQNKEQRSSDYRNVIQQSFTINHLVIEVI